MSPSFSHPEMNPTETLDALRDSTEAFIAFQNLTPDGFMLFDAVRDNAGVIIDFRWTFVNPAAARIVNRDAGDLLGKRLLDEIPHNREEGLFAAYAKVMETGTTWYNEFRYDHDGITGWFRTTAAKANDKLALSFADITEIHKEQERAKRLLDGVIAFVGVLSPEGILQDANEPAVTASGLERSALIGTPFWDCYWWNFDPAGQERLRQAVAAAARGERVRYDAEIRVVGDHRIWIDFQMVPVMNADGVVTEIIPSGVDITERKQAEAQRELLMNELSHRVKNTLATIQSIAGQTIRTAATTDEFRASFSARLRSIAASHDLLVASHHETASLAALINNQVRSYAANEDQLKLVGEDKLLDGDVAHGLGLVLHELATNASKYGALSVPTGTVTISWDVQESAETRTLSLNWIESGGPPVTPPTRQGFGTRLIERSLASDNDDVAITYAPDGVQCRLELEL